MGNYHVFRKYVSKSCYIKSREKVSCIPNFIILNTYVFIIFVNNFDEIHLGFPHVKKSSIKIHAIK